MNQPNFPDRSGCDYPNPPQWMSLDDLDRQANRNHHSSTLLVGIFISAVIASSIAALYLFNLLPRATSPTPTSTTSLNLPVAGYLASINSIESTF